ncbi:hypothetical protein OF83DRAFT_1178992 [Amylostereum chailletii]|nr:hypothetical protein OF83DRAFT_1178992 [Amylostereum chailletii]
MSSARKHLERDSNGQFKKRKPLPPPPSPPTLSPSPPPSPNPTEPMADSPVEQQVSQMQTKVDALDGDIKGSSASSKAKAVVAPPPGAGRARSAAPPFPRPNPRPDADVSDYMSLASVTVPLGYFFNILLRGLILAGVQSSEIAIVATSFIRYLVILTELSILYDWEAVREYHAQFFDSCVASMARDEWNVWGTIDTQLQAACLFGCVKTSCNAYTSGSGSQKTQTSKTFKLSTAQRELNMKTDCNKFQLGKCPSPCEFSRRHVCSGCGSTEHGMIKHDPNWKFA